MLNIQWYWWRLLNVEWHQSSSTVHHSVSESPAVTVVSSVADQDPDPEDPRLFEHPDPEKKPYSDP